MDRKLAGQRAGRFFRPKDAVGAEQSERLPFKAIGRTVPEAVPAEQADGLDGSLRAIVSSVINDRQNGLIDGCIKKRF